MRPTDRTTPSQLLAATPSASAPAPAPPSSSPRLRRRGYRRPRWTAWCRGTGSTARERTPCSRRRSVVEEVGVSRKVVLGHAGTRWWVVVGRYGETGGGGAMPRCRWSVTSWYSTDESKRCEVGPATAQRSGPGMGPLQLLGAVTAPIRNAFGTSSPHTPHAQSRSRSRTHRARPCGAPRGHAIQPHNKQSHTAACVTSDVIGVTVRTGRTAPHPASPSQPVGG